MKHALAPLFLVTLAFGCSGNAIGKNGSPEQAENQDDPSSYADPNDDPSNEGADTGSSEDSGSDSGPPSNEACVFNSGGSPRVIPSGWSAVAPITSIGLPADMSMRSSLWTGHEVLGYGVHGESEGVDGALSYNPTTDTWMKLPPAPLSKGSIEVMVMAGPNRFALWGGRQYDYDGAVFDLCTKTWSKIPKAPIVGRSVAAYAYVAATDELIVWGGVRSSTPTGFPNPGPIGAITDGAAYHFATGTWRVIANPTYAGDEPHWSLGFDATSTASGKMVIYGGGPSHGGGPTIGEAFAYDAAADTWTELVGPPIQGRMYSGEQQAVNLGTSTLFFGGSAIREPLATPGDGALLDHATLTWTAIPAPTADVMPAPLRSWQAYWMLGGKIYAWGGQMADTVDPTEGKSGAVYDPSTHAWSAMPSGGPGGLQHGTQLNDAAFVSSDTEMMLFKP